MSDALHGPHVAPSILAADYWRLGAEIEEVLAAGARVIHVDVMDGHFVPPISIGLPVVASLEEPVHAAGGWLDVHLMIERPERQIAAFAAAGADSISIHVEATPHARYAVEAVHEAGCRAGVALNPGTSAETASQLAGPADLLLCMTVNPGWGGQAFIAGSEAKVAALRELGGPDTAVEVDGGIDVATAGPCARAGANLFVAGSSVFGEPDPGAAYKRVAAEVGG